MFNLEVSIIKATGMKHMNMTGDAIWCACEVKHRDKRAHPTRVETKAVGKTLDPEWDESFQIEHWCVGEPLEFTLYDKGMLISRTEGTVCVPSDHFFPNGFEGRLSVTGLEHATLQIRIVPCIPQTAPSSPVSPGECTFQSESSPKAGTSARVVRRVQKGMEQNVRTVQHRINYFKREEEKIWRGLEDARRQAVKIEEGRSRLLEKETAEDAIKLVKHRCLMENRIRAKAQREDTIRQRKQNTLETLQAKRFSSLQQKKETQDLERWKRLQEIEQRRTKSERVVSMQREMIEAKLRSNQDRSERLARIREGQEQARLDAQRDVEDVESRLPDLEAQEIACLQRLQNSRYVEQTVLKELEASLGAPSAVTNLLRSKHSRSPCYFDPQQELNQSCDSAGSEGRAAAAHA